MRPGRTQMAGWLLLAILTPLWINIWSQQPFELPRVALVRTLVWLLAGLALITSGFTRQWWQRLGRQPMTAALGLLGLVIVASTVTATDWRLSLWGSTERMQGAVTLLTYLLLCLLATQLQLPGRIRRVLMALAGGSGALAGIALLQAGGWNVWGLVSDARSPLYGTLGRANIVGAYVAMTVPLTLALMVGEERQGRRVLWGVLLGAQLLTTALTLARGAWLALIVGLATFGLLWWGRSWRRSREGRFVAGDSARKCLLRAGWLAIGALVVAGPLAVLGWGAALGGSWGARLAIYRGAWQLIGEQPLLGYGADAVGVVFWRVYAPELVTLQGREVFVDRAHNLLLDWMLTAGVAGLLAFLLVLGTFAVVVWRAWRDARMEDGRRVVLAGIVAGVAANLANNMVSFDVTATATAMWLLLGLGVGLAHEEEDAVGASALAGHGYGTGWKRGAALGAMGLVLLLSWQVNGRLQAADMLAYRAETRLAQGNVRAALRAAERAVALWPDEPAYHVRLARTQEAMGAVEGVAADRWQDAAADSFRAAASRRPDDAGYWLELAHFYRRQALRANGGAWTQAHEAYAVAARLAPTQGSVFRAWGHAYLLQGEAREALARLREAVRLDGGDGEAFLFLGAAELALGRLPEAAAAYGQAVRFLPKAADGYAGLARAYEQMGDRERALAAARMAGMLLAGGGERLQSAFDNDE